jgi:hypothetical protein
VRQAARGHDDDAEILRIRRDRAAERLAELVAACRRRQRVLDRVHGDRHAADDALAAPEQRVRHRERVIDAHLLARRDVELVGDERLDDVPRKLGVAGIGRQRRKAPAFVGVLIFGRRADRERGQIVEEEVQAVIVVDDDGRVGLRPLEPLAHGRIAREERPPVVVLLEPACDRVADRGDVRGADSADEPRHVSGPPPAASA